MKTVKVQQMQVSTVQIVQSGIVTTDAVREIGECFSQIGQGVH